MSDGCNVFVARRLTYLLLSSIVVGVRRSDIGMDVVSIADPTVVLYVLVIAAVSQLRRHPTGDSTEDERCGRRDKHAD